MQATYFDSKVILLIRRDREQTNPFENKAMDWMWLKTQSDGSNKIIFFRT